MEQLPENIQTEAKNLEIEKENFQVVDTKRISQVILKIVVSFLNNYPTVAGFFVYIIFTLIALIAVGSIIEFLYQLQWGVEFWILILGFSPLAIVITLYIIFFRNKNLDIMRYIGIIPLATKIIEDNSLVNENTNLQVLDSKKNSSGETFFEKIKNVTTSKLYILTAIASLIFIIIVIVQYIGNIAYDYRFMSEYRQDRNLPLGKSPLQIFTIIFLFYGSICLLLFKFKFFKLIRFLVLELVERISAEERKVFSTFFVICAYTTLLFFLGMFISLAWYLAALGTIMILITLALFAILVLVRGKGFCLIACLLFLLLTFLFFYVVGYTSLDICNCEPRFI